MAGAARPPDRFCEGVALTTIRTVASAGSTNVDMLGLAARGLGEGIWLRARRQTAGRGREGREWVSPEGNLYASTLIRLRPGDPAATGLALVAGVVVAEVLAGLAFRFTAFNAPRFSDLPLDAPWPGEGGTGGVTLKWPNDVLVARAKVAGILLERAGDAVVIGIGVNVASHPDDTTRPATSLAAQGVDIDPDQLLRNIASALPGLMEIWRSEGLEPIRLAWLHRAQPIGTPLVARLPGGTSLHGRFAGLRVDGALRLALEDGSEHMIHAGDVFAV